MIFVCLLETFYFEIIAFPDRTLSLLRPLLRWKVSRAMWMEECLRVRTALPPVLALMITFAFDHKLAQRSFAGVLCCLAEPSGTSFEGCS